MSAEVAAAKGAFAELRAIDDELAIMEVDRNSAESDYREIFGQLSPEEKKQLASEQDELNNGFWGMGND